MHLVSGVGRKDMLPNVENVEEKREVARRDMGDCGNVSFRQNQQVFARAWVLRRKSHCLTVVSGECVHVWVVLLCLAAWSVQ